MIVDRNQMSTIGKTEDLLKLESIEKKFTAFGMLAITIDGHNYDQLQSVFSMPQDGIYEPLVVVAKTVKGKGVSYMEGRFEYHNTIPKDPKLIEQALNELS
jgi:transketolase